MCVCVYSNKYVSWAINKIMYYKDTQAKNNNQSTNKHTYLVLYTTLVLYKATRHHHH